MGILCVICWAIQLLPVISVPITGQHINYDLHFSLYNNFTFGVFGVCDIVRNVCSKPRIGYPVSDLFYYIEIGEDVDEDALDYISLPSDATHSISKLLVVHIVAFFFTSVLLMETCYVLWLVRWDKKHPGVLAWNALKKKEPSQKKPQKRKLTSHLNWMLSIALLSFVLTLLAFLADILLFIPKLSFLGWIQLLPILVMVFIACLICLFKRSVSSRKHLEDEAHPVDNDDMRAKNVRWVDDSASDDGFYIYTNRFHNANESGTSQRNLSGGPADSTDHIYEHYQYPSEGPSRGQANRIQDTQQSEDIELSEIHRA